MVVSPIIYVVIVADRRVQVNDGCIGGSRRSVILLAWKLGTPVGLPV